MEERARNRKKPIVLFVILALIVGLGLYVTVKLNEKKIRDDVEKNIAMIRSGDLSWTSISTMDMSSELRGAMTGNAAGQESFIDMLIAASEIEYKIGMVKWNTCEVTYTVDGYSFADYIAYCRTNGYTTNADMNANFETYMTTHSKNRHEEVTMTYKKTLGRWICDYNDSAFLDAMSGGMITSYEGYYNKMIDDMQRMIDYLDEKESDNE